MSITDLFWLFMTSYNCFQTLIQKLLDIFFNFSLFFLTHYLKPLNYSCHISSQHVFWQITYTLLHLHKHAYRILPRINHSHKKQTHTLQPTNPDYRTLNITIHHLTRTFFLPDLFFWAEWNKWRELEFGATRWRQAAATGDSDLGRFEISVFFYSYAIVTCACKNEIIRAKKTLFRWSETVLKLITHYFFLHLYKRAYVIRAIASLLFQ